MRKKRIGPWTPEEQGKSIGSAMAIASTANLLLGIPRTSAGRRYRKFMIEEVGMDEELCDGGTWLILTPMLPFAIELCLKSIKSQSGHAFLKSHDLKELWEDLHEGDRSGIKSRLEDPTWKQREERRRSEFGLTGGIRPLHEVLNDHRNDFQNWRYVVEGEKYLTPRVTSISIDESIMDFYGIVFACVTYHQNRNPSGVGA